MTASILVCFAVEQEASPFRQAIKANPVVRILVTGMGKANAARMVRAEMERGRPELVLTCGFAGGLNPSLKNGAVIFEADDLSLAGILTRAGASEAKFHCGERVAVTAAEKRALRESTGRDAVEMESGVIREACRERGINSATVRVISDAADEDLPLDFNALMTAEQEMNYAKLAGALVRSPGKIGDLMTFQKCLKRGAQNLAAVLAEVVKAKQSPR